MKKVFKLFFTCLLVLSLSLSFYGCKGDVGDGFNASFYEVFYTSFNPHTTDYNLLTHETSLIRSSDYWLVASYHQPNMDAVMMILEYEEDGEIKEKYYSMSQDYVDQTVCWNNVNWNGAAREDNKELKFYLKDADGNRSAPYTLTVNLW